MKPIINDETSVILTRLHKLSVEKKITTDTYSYDFNDRGSTKTKQSNKTSYVPSEFVILDILLLQNLTAAEVKMVAKISAELKRKNVFWEYDYLKAGGKYTRTFRSLRKKDIVIATDNPTIHIVNPFFIRRGDITQAVNASLNQLRAIGYVVSSKLIIHLDRKPDTLEIDLYDDGRA